MRRVLLGMLAFLVAFGVFAGIQAACSTRVLPFDPASYVPEQFSEAVYAIPETDFERYDWTPYAPDELLLMLILLPLISIFELYDDVRRAYEDR